jgi:hypothetical protein
MFLSTPRGLCVWTEAHVYMHVAIVEHILSVQSSVVAAGRVSHPSEHRAVSCADVDPVSVRVFIGDSEPLLHKRLRLGHQLGQPPVARHKKEIM